MKRTTSQNPDLQNQIKKLKIKAKLTPDFITAYKQWKDGVITSHEAIERLGMRQSTFYRWAQEYESITKPRPKNKITPAFLEAYRQWKAGTIKVSEAMELANLKKKTFYNRVKEYEASLAVEKEETNAFEPS